MSVSSGGSPHDEGGVVDRLDEIQGRAATATDLVHQYIETGGEAHEIIMADRLLQHARTDVPALVATLRAVLDVCEKSEMGSYPEPKYDEYVPGQLDTTERVRAAIASALGEA